MRLTVTYVEMKGERMNKIVYVVNDRPKKVIDILKENGFEVLVGNGEFWNEEYLSKCWALMPGRGYFTKEDLAKAPNLKLICKQGVGLDRIDVKACEERGVCVKNTPATNATSVAEHAVALMLACAKQLYPITLSIRGEVPDNSCAQKYPSCELSGKTLGIIGFGNIGRRVAKMAGGFDMKILAYEKFMSHLDMSQIPADVELTDDLERVLAEADFISLHVSGVEENRNLIGKRELELMKKSAILINTTRGFVVDEDALYDALVEKRIWGAGLDVFVQEPLKPGNKLLKLENVMATVHSAANTEEARQRSYTICARTILDFAEKNPE